MSYNVTGLPLSQGLLTPTAHVDAEYMNGDQAWENVDEYISYKNTQYARIFKNKTILVKQSDGSVAEMWNPNSANIFIVKNTQNGEVFPTSDGYAILSPTASFQSQVTEPNTIYEIRNSFNLQGTFEMPDNCTLLFNGGKLTDGTLRLKNTVIERIGKSPILFDVTLTGNPGSDLKASFYSYSSSHSLTNFQKLKSLYAVVRGSKYNVDFDLKELYLLYDKTIVLDSWKKYDFHNAVIYARSVQAEGSSEKGDKYLFQVEGNPTQTTYKKINEAVLDTFFTDKQGLIIAEDNTPWYQRYSAEGSHQTYYRKDIMLVQNNELCNYPIMDYDNDPDTDATISFLSTDNSGFEFCNLRYKRDGATYTSALVKCHYIFKPHIHDLLIDTPELPDEVWDNGALNENGAVQVFYSYGAHLHDITVSTSYRHKKVGEPGGRANYCIRMAFSTNVILERVYTNATWHSYALQFINTIILRDCVSDQYDNHCYSKDITMENCIFHTDHIQDPEVGYIRFNNCKFLQMYVGVEEDSDVFTYPIRRIFDNCTFEVQEYSLLKVSKKYPTVNPRTAIISYKYPSLIIRNCTINVDTRVNTFTLYSINPDNAELFEKADSTADIMIEDLIVNTGSRPLTLYVIDRNVNTSVSINGLKSNKGDITLNTSNCKQGTDALDIRRCQLQQSR